MNVLRDRWTLCVALLLAIASAPDAAAQAGPSDAAAFNGTWEMRAEDIDGARGTGAEFRIWALNEREFQVEFTGLYAYKSASGPMANVGTASGVAVVDRGKAAFQSEGGLCAFTLRLRDDLLVVTQSGYGCFGLNVTAAGTYNRVDANRPTFEYAENGSR